MMPLTYYPKICTQLLLQWRKILTYQSKPLKEGYMGWVFGQADYLPTKLF